MWNWIKCFFGFHQYTDWYFSHYDSITQLGMTSYEKTTCDKCGKRGERI